MNLFDYTYCGNYNRQIQNLSRIVRRNGVLAAQKTTVSSRAIWNILFRGFMKKEKYWKQRIMRFSIQDYLIDTISPSMYILYQIRCRTGRDGFWKDFIQSIIF